MSTKNSVKKSGRPLVSVFYSYSHKDAPMQIKLHAELQRLGRSRKFEIRQWYDGCIRPGAEFEPEIAEQLKRSDIVLLLLTPAFIDSEYCYENELELALQQHREGNVRVIPVLLKEVAWRDRKFSPFQAIPQDKSKARPVEKWRPQSAGFVAIRKQLASEIRELISPGIATDVSKVTRTLQKMSARDIEQIGAHQTVVKKRYRSVMQFWADRAHLREGDLIEIEGTFSDFAPLLIGYPKAKRALHMSFRKALEKSPQLARIKSRTINACMSISSGQMVYRDRNIAQEGVFCGLYESIVRNSIPIFITRQFYESSIREIMLKNSCDTFYANIVARVTMKKMTKLKQFIKKYDITHVISKQVIDDLCQNSLGLLVDGKSTSISFAAPAKYLDGDIWIAGETRGSEFFETTFIDIGDPRDREDALVILRQKLDEHRGNPRLVGQYDEVGQLSNLGIDSPRSMTALEKIFHYGLDMEHQANRG